MSLEPRGPAPGGGPRYPSKQRHMELHAIISVSCWGQGRLRAPLPNETNCAVPHLVWCRIVRLTECCCSMPAACNTPKHLDTAAETSVRSPIPTPQYNLATGSLKNCNPALEPVIRSTQCSMSSTIRVKIGWICRLWWSSM